MDVLDLANLAVGVAVVVGTGEIILKKVERPKYDLAELVALIPKGYESQEVSTFFSP